MIRILILSDCYPIDLTEGRHLRVYSLCRELIRQYECFFVALSGGKSISETNNELLFSGFELLDELPRESQSVFRHSRISNARFLQRAWPKYFTSTRDRVQKLASQWRVDCVINMAPAFAEIGATVDVPTMQDITDCDTLTIERVMTNRGADMSFKDRMSMRLNYIRQIGRERALLRNYGITTTISQPDRQRFLEISNVSESRVVVVPNGVSPAALAAGDRHHVQTRSIVFWGNLDFPPNWTAVNYFFEQIFLPYLAEKDVNFFIVGAAAGDRIQEIGNHRNVQVVGFQKDLFKFIADKGVMINPMVEGSGLKNKVLEAFAAGIPVVSTQLGVEAINGIAEQHYLVADEPGQFAAKVLALLDDDVLSREIAEQGRQLVEDLYTWQAVGVQYGREISRLVCATPHQNS